MAAYQNYFPTYQPYQMYQPYQQQFQQQQTQMQTSIIWVSSEQEAQNYPVAPNNAVALWDSSAPAIYLKQADASGKPTLKAYDLVERAQNSVSSQQGKVTDFAMKSDLDALSSAVDAIKSEVKTMRRQMKKQEAEDDE